MWNMVDNFDVKCSRERLREIWWRTFDVECSRERLREICRRTVMLGRNA